MAHLLNDDDDDEDDDDDDDYDDDDDNDDDDDDDDLRDVSGVGVARTGLCNASQIRWIRGG